MSDKHSSTYRGGSKPYDETQRRTAFWSRVAIGDPDGCWEWQGFRRPDGYGHAWMGRSSQPTHWLSHRAALYYATGECPPELDVLHDCDNPACCNPMHLRLGTHVDNTADCHAKGRTKAKLDDCEIDAVLARLSAGELQRSIARDYRVNQATISNIATGKRQRRTP